MTIKSTLSEKQIKKINTALEQLAQMQVYRYPRKHQFIKSDIATQHNTKTRQKDSTTRQSLYQLDSTCLSCL